MSDDEQRYEAQRTGRLREAQERAVFWAWTANGEYVEAIGHEDRSRAAYNPAIARQGDRIAQERRLADFHGVRSTEALKLAEMWARVAQALATGELPVTGMVEVPDPARPGDSADVVPAGRPHP
ncbi:hypothetical protein ACIQPR_18250 [Streptomyces sp. NPDC091280]|uniref:hypothetical protein n=1 Tax=Streptomyces sp. NPDC091280 TaxID=3365984 RepID=UPI00381A25DB